jgi:hypothetical protein
MLFKLPEEIQEIIWREVFQGSLNKLKLNASVKNTCDCCLGGYYDNNEFGLCKCHCSKCFEMMKDCLYKCEYYNNDTL